MRCAPFYKMNQLYYIFGDQILQKQFIAITYTYADLEWHREANIGHIRHMRAAN